MNLLKITDKENKLVAIVDIDKIYCIENEGDDECGIWLVTGGETHRLGVEKSIKEVAALIDEYNINKDVENIILKGNNAK